MAHFSIERINELAKKSRTVGLTEQEKQEQDALRKEYIKGFRTSLDNQLQKIVIVEQDGTHTKVEKKENKG